MLFVKWGCVCVRCTVETSCGGACAFKYRARLGFDLRDIDVTSAHSPRCEYRARVQNTQRINERCSSSATIKVAYAQVHIKTKCPEPVHYRGPRGWQQGRLEQKWKGSRPSAVGQPGLLDHVCLTGPQPRERKKRAWNVCRSRQIKSNSVWG